MEVGRLKAFIGKSRLGCPSAQRFASDWGFENVMNGGECVGRLGLHQAMEEELREDQLMLYAS